MYLQYVNLYQVSLKDKSKRVKIHATKNVPVEANVDINNVIVKKIPFSHEVVKSIEVFEFL